VRSRDSRARLDRLVAELRAQPPPAPPNELPSRVRAEFRRVNAAGWASRSRAAGAAWLPRLVAVSALALGAALVVGRFAGTSGPPPALPGPTAVAPPASVARLAVALLDGEPLALDEPVTALDQPRRVEHPGRASWVLSPGSRGRALSAANGVLRIALEHGSLDAEVLPSHGAAAQTQNPAESFIVEAQGTEVAVHGTRFRVTLSGERTEVAVSQGQVVVRPLGQGAGTLLDAGMSAEFRAGVVAPAVPAAPATSSSGSAQAVSAQPRAALRPERAAPASTPGVSAAPTAGARRPPQLPAPSSSPAHTPSAAVVESALRAITERVQGCFRRHTSGPSELGIELSTDLGFSVEPSGELLQADFEPPLAPAVEACVAAELEQLRLAPSPEGYRVQREIRLSR
jgi:hypothetical protein